MCFFFLFFLLLLLLLLLTGTVMSLFGEYIGTRPLMVNAGDGSQVAVHA